MPPTRTSGSARPASAFRISSAANCSTGEKTDLRIANLELSRVNADRQATDAGVDVVPRERPLSSLIQFA